MAKHTDEDFIEVWNKFKSPVKVAEALKINIRTVNYRRRGLEQKYKIQLEATDDRAKKFANNIHLIKARHIGGIIDGTVLVFSDAHFWPNIRTTAFQGLLWAINTLKPVMVVNNGDAFDGATISRYPRSQWQQRPSVRQELDACKEYLKEIEDACHKVRHHTQLVWPLGNHDARLESRLSAMVPEFEGVTGLTLKDHFPKWTPCWSCWPVPNVVIKHRYKNGVHATHNNTVNAGLTIVTGHLHSLKVTPFDDYRGTRWGVDTGTLADTDGPQFLDYLEDSPTNWRSGFVVLTFKDGQLLMPEIARKHSDGFIDFRGQLIGVSGY
jgi:hypothetical protein